MVKIKVIKLVYNIVDKADYVYLSEFFRFIGVFVCEDIINRDKSLISNAEKHTQYDSLINIEHFIEKFNQNRSHLKIEEDKKSEQMSSEDITKKIDNSKNSPIIRKEKEEQKKILNYMVSYICEENGISDLPNNEKLKKLIDIYVDFEIAYHSINLQYYPKKKSDIIQKAKDSFIDAYNIIANIEGYQELFYMYYATVWCRVKANLACDYIEQVPYFFIEELSKDCQGLYETYPDYNNAKVLLGLCYEPFKNSANEALLAFANSLLDIKENYYSSSIYYWMGRWFEYYDKKIDAKKAYELANKKRTKYRSAFKLAVLAKEEKDYEKALEFFNQILQELEVKLKSQYADPLELQYIFKTYVQKCSIYYEQDNYEKIIENGKKAIEVKTNINNNKYLDIFYGNENIQYKTFIQKRLELQNVYWFLIGAYRKNNREQEAMQYEELMEKELIV